MDEKTLEREREKKREKFFCFAFFRETCCLFSFASLRHMSVCENLSNLSAFCVLSFLWFIATSFVPHTRATQEKKNARLCGLLLKSTLFSHHQPHAERERERERNVNNTFGGLCFSSARDDDDDFDDDFDDETVLSVIFAWGGQKDFERFYRRECTASKAT